MWSVGKVGDEEDLPADFWHKVKVCILVTNSHKPSETSCYGKQSVCLKQLMEKIMGISLCLHALGSGVLRVLWSTLSTNSQGVLQQPNIFFSHYAWSHTAAPYNTHAKNKCQTTTSCPESWHPLFPDSGSSEPGEVFFSVLVIWQSWEEDYSSLWTASGLVREFRKGEICSEGSVLRSLSRGKRCLY